MGELLRAIRTVANGGAIFSPGIAQRVLGYLNTPEPHAPKHAFDELTNREREILELIARARPDGSDEATNCPARRPAAALR